MAGSFYSNNNDSMDISELANLNEDISDDFIAQLQQQLTDNTNTVQENSTSQAIDINDDSTLFQDIKTPEEKKENTTDKTETEGLANTAEQTQESSVEKNSSVNTNFDDNFIKKYKAKLNKKAQANIEKVAGESNSAIKDAEEQQAKEEEQIEALSKGNISEKPLTQELKDYNDSLDFLDGNVKYSKYVIYIDPQNVDFIEGLTVKERKNLINGILRQQDDIAITKQRFKLTQTIIRHVIIAIMTIAITIPVVYFVINASLEATIDNYRRSQSNWQVLYKENGKITPH